MLKISVGAKLYAIKLAIDNVVIPNKTAADSPTISNKNKTTI